MEDKLKELIHQLRGKALSSGHYKEARMDYEALRNDVESITDMMLRELNYKKCIHCDERFEDNNECKVRDFAYCVTN